MPASLSRKIIRAAQTPWSRTYSRREVGSFAEPENEARRPARKQSGAAVRARCRMQFPFESSLAANPPRPPDAAQAETAELLRQILEVQREQLTYLRASAAAHDMNSRWKAFLARWQEDFPGLSQA